MRKSIIAFLFLASCLSLKAQSNLSDKDLTNLAALGDIYTRNPECNSSGFEKDFEAERTPALSHMVDVFIAVGKGDKSIIDKEYLARPSDQELKMWYAVRRIFNNHSSDSKEKHEESIDIVKKTLKDTIDTRFMLDQYYYFIQDGIAMAFNNADWSGQNIDVESLGLKNTTEKAIFFVHVQYGMTQRFVVLQNNAKLLLKFVGKMPTFNNKPYYCYTDFNYPDFDWPDKDSTETYNDRYIGDVYNSLICHFAALANKKKKDQARDLYQNSILIMPAYFKYSSFKDALQQIYTSATSNN